MKTSIILSLAALLLSFSMAQAQESPLPSELRTQISEWRMNALPTLTSDAYWTELKELGSRVGEVNARRIEESESSDLDSAIASMAYQAWSQPQKLDEIAGWYGVYEGQVSRELRGVEDDEHWERIQARFNAKRTTFIVERLRDEHKQVGFLPAWEAWMLSPFSLEWEIMRPLINEALSTLGNERTISILVEKYRILPHQYPQDYRPDGRQKTIQEDLGSVRSLIREIGGPNAVYALLQCIRLAEAHGEAGQGLEVVKSTTVRALTSQINPDYLARNPEFADSVRDPNNPNAFLPFDDKWKEFRPIIEAILKDPKDLRAEDIRLLQDALAAMPQN